MHRRAVRLFSSATRTKQALPAALTHALDRGAPIDIHPEVEEALATNKPLVALETTIVTHGMPYPINLETARSVEKNVRSTGAIPATIGVIDGRVKIGLEPSQLEYLADTDTNTGSVKLSRRDLAAAIALKKDGGTTCSTTLILAALAGIKVFATGGLGGVHRGGENSMDVSADLQELTRCPVALVSAGVKSILDIGRTLEYLETLGVPVFTYGKTDDFPAFYSPRSGFKSPWRVNDPDTAANVLFAQTKLGMKNGVLFGVPIPESYAEIGEDLQKAVEQAVRESEDNGISRRGKEATPWLLRRVGQLTEGKSLASNIALIENTATKGGLIAVSYAKLLEDAGPVNADNSLPHQPPAAKPVLSSSPLAELPPATLVVVGSAAVDITARAITPPGSEPTRGLNSTSPGNVSLTLGGVGRNMAEAAHRVLTSHSTEFSHATLLISSVGEDSFGRLLVEEMARMGMRNDGITRNDAQRSAVCNMVVDAAGNLIGGVADMDIVRSFEVGKALQQIQKHTPRLVALDANLSPDTIKPLIKLCVTSDIKTFYEPTSVIKSAAILPAVAASLDASSLTRSPITFASPNLLELSELYNSARAEPFELMSHDYWWKVIDDFSIGTEFRLSLAQLARLNASDLDASKGTLSFLMDQGVAQMAVNLLPFFQNLVIKCGERGVILAMRFLTGESASWANERSNIRRRSVVAHGKSETVVLKHFPAHHLENGDIVNVTGAGDSLVGAMLASLTRDPSTFSTPEALDVAIAVAQRAAVKSLQSPLAVSPYVSAHLPEH
ncbi:indigoidine synthase A-like protein [Artomyces pyxidatus]|uniref:Indigoidine synthase A-like protein n=1 Tax=Artomyces pyxidatus TaxID=48021 RepID=A0ACB8TIG7_9AGAM|nr:indigoidine synthase A-like protein [Artomyces pyxidatus]